MCIDVLHSAVISKRLQICTHTNTRTHHTSMHVHTRYCYLAKQLIETEAGNDHHCFNSKPSKNYPVMSNLQFSI